MCQIIIIGVLLLIVKIEKNLSDCAKQTTMYK